MKPRDWFAIESERANDGDGQYVIGTPRDPAPPSLWGTPVVVTMGMPELGALILVIQMLSPQASGPRQSGSPDNLPSYAFGSAKNTTASGNPVPICIGYRRWGGAIISASIYAEDEV